MGGGGAFNLRVRAAVWRDPQLTLPTSASPGRSSRAGKAWMAMKGAAGLSGAWAPRKRLPFKPTARSKAPHPPHGGQLGLGETHR